MERDNFFYGIIPVDKYRRNVGNRTPTIRKITELFLQDELPLSA